MVLLLRLLCVLLVAAAGPARATDVEGISFAPRADGPGVLVRLHASGPVERYTVEPERGRVAITLFGAHVASNVRQERAALPVRRYTVDERGERVVIRFDVAETVEAVAYRDGATNDLMLVLTPAAPQGRALAWGGTSPRTDARVPDAPPPRPAVRPQPTPPARTRTTPAPRRSRPPAPLPTPTTAEPVSPTPSSDPVRTPEAGTPASLWRLDTIVLDAGHGNHDIGATYHGVREKDVTLGITQRLGRMIERELGVRVIYTRRGDQFHELRERGRIANREGGKLFISIHANAAGSASARGTETYFLAPHRTSAAAEVMDRENSVIDLESDPSLYAEFTSQSGDILQAMAMSAFQEESQALAGLIEGEFRGSGRHSRGVKQAGFLVLWAASMPAVLVETGFISNPDEGRYLASETGQEETARAIFRAVAAYRDQYERGTRLAMAP